MLSKIFVTETKLCMCLVIHIKQCSAFFQMLLLFTHSIISVYEAPFTLEIYFDILYLLFIYLKLF